MPPIAETHLSRALKRVLPKQHNIQHNATGPDVSKLAIIVACCLDHFWGHVRQSSNLCVCVCVCVCVGSTTIWFVHVQEQLFWNTPPAWGRLHISSMSACHALLLEWHVLIGNALFSHFNRSS